jgi:hypothetical protein
MLSGRQPWVCGICGTMGLGSVSPKLHILQHIAVVMSKMTDQWIFGGISSFGEIHVI